MFIDTATANSRSLRPQIMVSSHPESHNDTETPLLETFVGQDAPPPTYLEATTPGLYSSRLSEDQGARLLASGDREERDAAVKEDQYRRKILRAQCTKTRVLKWAAAAMTIFLLAAVLAVMAAAVSVRGDKQAAVANPHHAAQLASGVPLSPPTFAQPSKEDDDAHPHGFIDDGSERPDLIAIPVPSATASPTSKEVFPIRWPSRCGKEYNVKTEDYDFGTEKELNIQEAVHQLDGPYKRVQGWIHIAKAPSDQAPGTVQARMSYAVSSSVDVNSVRHSSKANGLTIGDPSFPDGFDGKSSGTACLGMSVVLYMASGATLDTLTIASTHMGMQVHPGANFSVTDSTSISLTTGTLDAAVLNSRQTHLRTISGSISGKYSLNDLVSINTKSGSVNIDVEPKAAVEGSSNPAVFMIDSLSSSVRVDFHRKHIPERDYQTYINTTVGSVDGAFIHGSRTEINSVAGVVTADLLPFKSGDIASTINTHTHSGQTKLTVRTPYKAKNVPMTGLTSLHKSTSGGLDVTYPQEWSGHVDGTSLSGALHIQGKDLELIKENNEPGKNHVEAKKGDGGSRMAFETVSGGCEVKVGKV